MIKVEGYNDLARDEGSKAIVNTNVAAYNAAIRRAKIIREKDDRINSLEDNINTLYQEVNSIKDMLNGN
jgi:hypothetical protein